MSEIGANSLFLEHIGIMPKYADHMILSDRETKVVTLL